jgi:hypothetical protein
MMQLQAISDGKLDMNQSASLLASLFNKFQINPAETLGTANIGGQSFEGTSMKAMEMVSMMAKAAHDAHMDFDMMSKSLRAAGASMQFTNTSFSEFLAISGSLVKAGYTPAQAGQYQNAISNAAIIATRMRDMTPDAKRAQVASELGVDLNTFKTSDNIIKTLLDIQESAYQKYGSQGAISKLSFLFNTNGMKELQALQNLHQLRQDGKVDMNALEMAADIEKAGS